MVLYTVQVNTDGAATSTLLRNCASNTPNTTDHSSCQLPDRVIIMAVLEAPNTGNMAFVDAAKNALRAMLRPFELTGYFAFGA